WSHEGDRLWGWTVKLPLSASTDSIRACTSSSRKVSTSCSSARRTPICMPTSVKPAVTTTTAAFQIIRRKRIVRATCLSRAENIASASHGVDQRVFAAPVELAPQPVDVHVDHVGDALPVFAPDVLVEHLAGDDVSGVPHQKLKD